MDYEYGSGIQTNPVFPNLLFGHTINISGVLSYVESRLKPLDMYISLGLARENRKTVRERDRGYRDKEGRRIMGQN